MGEAKHSRARWIVAGPLLAMGMLVLVAGAGPADAAFPGKNGKIAFASLTKKGGVIYTIKPGGGGKTKVTEGSEPSYSPNGKKIAYLGNTPANPTIFTIGVGGGGKVKVTDTGAADSEPSWGSK